VTETETELLEKLANRIHRMEVTLYGDEEAYQVWKAAKETNTCPNIDEPGPGFIATMGELAIGVSEMLDSFDAALPKKVERLDARISAFLAEQPASKIFVDEAINRLNGALREHFGKVFTLQSDGLMGLELRVDRWLAEIKTSLHGWSRYRAEVLEHRPSRLASLVHAITGRTPPNGRQ